MSTNTKLAEALRALEEAARKVQAGEMDAQSIQVERNQARAVLAAHDAEQAQKPVAWGWQWRKSGKVVDLIYDTREAAEMAWEANGGDGQIVAVCLCDPAPVEQAAQAAQAVPEVMTPRAWHESEAEKKEDVTFCNGWNACREAMLAAAPAAPAPETQAVPASSGIVEAAEFAANVLAEIYAKHQRKIGPFASQAQLANVRLGAALKACKAASVSPRIEPSAPWPRTQGSAAPAPEAGSWVNADDVARFARDLAVAMHGENAAPRPSLCDVVPEAVKRLATQAQPYRMNAVEADAMNRALVRSVRFVDEARAAGQELPPLPSPDHFETTYRVVGFGDGTLFADRPGDLAPNGRKAVAYTAEKMRAYASAALAQSQPLTEAARRQIGQWLNNEMGAAVSRGANSVSMPDELVEIAAWLAGATTGGQQR